MLGGSNANRSIANWHTSGWKGWSVPRIAAGLNGLVRVRRLGRPGVMQEEVRIPWGLNSWCRSRR